MQDGIYFDEHFNRSGLDRRFGMDRRAETRLLPDAYSDMRASTERRQQDERRDGWVKVSQWHSAVIGIPIA